MAIEVACIMSAGQAGLKSMPYFIDAFIDRGIPQLVPRPFDHDNNQIQELDREFRANWTKEKLYGMGDSRQLATKMELDDDSIFMILEGINPIEAADQVSTMHDSPARLAAWCRLRLKDECRKLLGNWDAYKNLRSLGRADQLAVVIPYCPEGPTSGTVGMFLGATMIQCCQEERRDDVVVWGIELCPPIPEHPTGNPARNVFRGYVARSELMAGVPLSADDPHDDVRKRCFHINIAFDGGYSPAPYTADADVLPALDSAAAQGTACLLTKTGTADKGETVDALKVGTGRWNACMVNVVSEASYSPAFRCLGHRSRLPWNQDPDRWQGRNMRQKRERFLASVQDIERAMKSESTPEVMNWFKPLKEKAANLDKLKFSERFLNKKDQTLIEAAQKEEEQFYGNLLKDDPPNEKLMVRSQPFCINVGLSEEVRATYAARMVDSNSPGHHTPLAEILGIANANEVQTSITRMCRQFLQRPDIDIGAPSRAMFQEIRAISIRTVDNRLNDADFRPTETAMRAYLDVAARELWPPYFVTHDLTDAFGGSVPMTWRPFMVDQQNNDRKERISHDIPVDYSFLVLARVKDGEDFRDLSTYPRLESYHDNVKNSEDWYNHAKYYAVKLPPKLLEMWAERKQSESHDTEDGRLDGPMSPELAPETV